MAVKELEYHEITNADNSKGNTEMYLSDDGATINLEYETLGDAGTVLSQLTVLFYNIDMMGNSFEFHPAYVGEAQSKTITAFQADISSVQNIPVYHKIDIRSTEVIVDLFTYEANVDTTYGSKRISFPYTATLQDTKFNKTTDGVYRIVLTNMTLWQGTVNYADGSLISRDNIAYRCVTTNTGVIPGTDENYWRVATEDDFVENASAPVDTAFAQWHVAHTGLISREIKQQIFIPVLKGANFRNHDDAQSLHDLDSYTHMLEMAFSSAKKGDVFRSQLLLDGIKSNYNAGTTGKPSQGQARIYTNYTL